MSTKILDPGEHFRQALTSQVKLWRESQIDKIVTEFRNDLRKRLIAEAAKCGLDVENYYRVAEGETHVVVTLKLPK